MSAAQLALFAGGFAAGMVFLALVLIVARRYLLSRFDADDQSRDNFTGEYPQGDPRPASAMLRDG